MSVKNQSISPDPHINSIALDVTRKAVEELAPEEFYFIDELIRENKMNTAADDDLAFGLEALIAPLTPAIWATLIYCLPKIFDATVDVAKDSAKDWVKKKFGKEKINAGALPAELSVELHAMIIANALKCGLTEKQAARLSVLLVERLEREGGNSQ